MLTAIIQWRVTPALVILVTMAMELFVKVYFKRILFQIHFYCDQCMHYCVDECETREICHENADCTNTRGSFTCDCQSGYEGDGYTLCRGTFYVQVKDYTMQKPTYSCF